MAELIFRVKAEYDSAVKCREELVKVSQQLNNINSETSKDEIDKLLKRHAALTAKWENSISLLGKAGVYVKELFSDVDTVVKKGSADIIASGNSTRDIITNAQKRLQVEESILDALKRQREEAVKSATDADEGYKRNKASYDAMRERLDKKYNGQAVGFYSQEDQERLEKGGETVNKWIIAWNNAVSKIKDYDSLIEKTKGDIESIDSVTKNIASGLSIENIHGDIAKTLDNIDALENRLSVLKRTLSEKENTEQASENLIKITGSIDAVKEKITEILPSVTNFSLEGLAEEQERLEQTQNSLEQSIKSESDSIEYYSEILERAKEGSKEWNDAQSNLDFHVSEKERYVNLLEDTKQRQEDLFKSTGELSKLYAEFDKNNSIASDSLSNQKEKGDIKSEIDDINQKLEAENVILQKQKDLYNERANEYSKISGLQREEVENEEESAEQTEEKTEKVVRLRTQIMNAREEMAKLIREGKMGTPEFQELAENAGEMRKEMQLSSAAMNYYADPNKNLHTLKTGLQGVAGAAGLVTSTIGLFNEDSKKMAEIQTKVQSVLGIVVGLETTYNLIKKSSNVMLAIEEVKTWALTKARVAQTTATESAAVAQEELNVAMSSNPIGAIIALLTILVAAIFAVVKAINSETEAEKKLKEMRESNEEVTRKAAITAERNLGTYEKLRKEWEKQGTILEKREQFIKDNRKAFEDLGLAIYDVKDAEKAFGKESDKTAMAVIENAEKVAKARQEWGKEAASTAAKQIMSYKKLQDQWEKLGNNLTQKNKFIKKNKNAFHELGMEVKTVKDAEHIFSQNTDTIVAAFRARAEAAAYSTAIMKEYEKQIEMELNGTYENGGKRRVLKRNEKGTVKIGDTKDEGYISAQERDKLVKKYGGDVIGKRRKGSGEYDLTDEMIADINNWRIEDAKAKQKTLIDKSNARIKDLEKKEEEAIKKQKEIIEAANIEYYEGEEDLTKEILAYKQRMYDLQLKQQEDALEQQRKAFNAAEDERIAAIEDANEREEESRKNQYRLNLEAIKKQEEAYKKANVERLKEEWSAKPENKDRIWANTNVAQDVLKNGYKNIDLTNEQKAELKSRENKVNTDEASRLKERVRNEQEAVVELLKVWGDYEEKRWAITQEYDEKRRVANTEEEKAALTLEENKKLEELKTENEKEAIDWDGIFSSFEGHTKSYLEGLRNQLQGLLSSGDITDLTQLQTIQEKLRGINEEINKQGSMFSFASERQREHTRLVQEAADAEKRRQVALQNENTISSDGNYLRFELARYGVSNVDLKQTNSEILKGLNPQSPEYKQMEDILNKLRVNEGKLAEARKKTAKATSEATNAEDAAHESLDDAVARHLGNINEWAQEYLGDLPELMDKLGFGEAGEKVQAGLNGLNDAAGAAQDFASGHFVSAALKGISAVENFGESLGLIAGSNREEIEKENARLTVAIQINTAAINRLTEEMKKQNPDEAYKSYQKAVNAMKSNELAERQKMENNVRIHDGGHSLWSDFWDNGGGKIVKEIYGVLGKEYKDQGLGTMVHDLSAADYNYLLKNYPDLMKKLGVAIGNAEDEGNYNGMFQDILNFADEFSEEAYEKLRVAFQEAVTYLNFDSMYSSFVSKLTDMDSKASDFAKDLEGYLRNAVMQSFAVDNIKPLLENWYKGLAVAMKSKKNGNYLDEKEINELMNTGGEYYDEETGQKFTFLGYNQIVQKGLEERNVLKELGISGSGSSQSSTFNSAQNITYEQGDSIAGSLINHSMLLETGNQSLTMLNATADNILKAQSEYSQSADDARDILAGMAIHVEQIRDGVVDTIVPKIKNIDSNLEDVKRLVENQ